MKYARKRWHIMLLSFILLLISFFFIYLLLLPIGHKLVIGFMIISTCYWAIRFLIKAYTIDLTKDFNWKDI
jgi:hypothetical protein